ncbi:MAG: PAS domain S-box protein, partial [Deltaproteobacteria bacterium]|nr:PAS domain S-box protein [Deltaproteobacteria bacterium]
MPCQGHETKKQIPVLKSIEPISLGGKLHYLSSFVDLRERKEFEKEIAKKQHEIETILDSVPAMIFYKDKNNRIVLANKTFSDITGFSKKDIEGKDCRELWPDQADDYWRDDKEVISTGRPKRNIIEKLETSRGTRWIKTDKVPYRNADGTIIGVIGFALDITELKEAEMALKESEERFRAISESAQDAIVMINEKGMVSFWNRAAETVFGYSKQEAMGRDLHELIAPKRYLEKYKKTFRIFRETGKGIAVNKILELDAKRKDGTEFPVELSLSAIQIKGKWHAVGIIRDITERKLMVKALKESEEQFRIAIENSNDGI